MKLYPEATNRFITEAGTVRTAASAATFRKDIRLLQKQHPNHHLADFTADDLTIFCLTRYDGLDGLPAPKTIKKRKSVIISLFDWAAYKRLIQSNPAVDLRFTVKPGGGTVRPGNWLTEQEAAEILQGFDLSSQLDRRDRLVIMIGLMLGLRVFEIAQLRRDMFSPDYATLRMVGKGDKHAELTVPAQLRRVLLDWDKEQRPLDAKFLIPGFRWHWMMVDGSMKRTLVSRWDKPLGQESYRYLVGKAGKRIGRKLAPHDLRRTFAGILEEKGVPLRDLQLAMRHSNLGTTDRYLKANPARLAKIMNEVTWDF